ncbi:MAG TPA: hypothetical protein VNJ71_12405 [Gemmatimonadales bacterium]|jgi:hypothetical protein|nr:hypothetical protein [Gemmatimonadales bacterium]
MQRLSRLTALATAAAFVFAIHGERLRMVECLHDALAGRAAGAPHSHHATPGGDQRAPSHGACLCLGLCHTAAAPAPVVRDLPVALAVPTRAPGFRPILVYRSLLVPFSHPLAHAPPPPIRLG